MSAEQQQNESLNESLNEVHVPLTEEAKKEHLEKYHGLIAEGEKSLLSKEFDKSVDFFSDATRLIDVVFGTFAPETFDAYLKYGSALVDWAHEQADLIRDAEDSEDSIESDSTGEEMQDAIDGEKLKVSADEEPKVAADEEPKVAADEEPKVAADEESKEITGDESIGVTIGELMKDVTGDESMNGQQLTDFDNIMKDAWEVLETAKKTCERALDAKPAGDEDRKWQLNLSDAFHLLGKVMMLDDQPDNAKEEFLKAVEIKQKHSSLGDRVLASVHFDLAKAFELNAEFANAKSHYEKVLEAFDKKIGLLEADKENAESAKEIEELKMLSEEVKKSIVDLAELEQTTADLKKLVENTFKNSLPPQAVGDSISDASKMTRKRSLKGDEQPADSIDESEAKKPKVDE